MALISRSPLTPNGPPVTPHIIPSRHERARRQPLHPHCTRLCARRGLGRLDPALQGLDSSPKVWLRVSNAGFEGRELSWSLSPP